MPDELPRLDWDQEFEFPDPRGADADGLVGTAAATIKVRDPNDTTAPVVLLDASSGDPLLRDGVVTGAVRDTNLDFWTRVEKFLAANL